jgi:hypothetical protein
MRKLVPGLALLLVIAGCRTPALLGGEFSHRTSSAEPTGPEETLSQHQRWVFFWGLLGTEKTDVPEMGGVFDIRKEVADKFGPNERIVDLVVEEGGTLPGVVTAFFTLGIVSQREIVVKGRRITVASTP